MTHNRPLTIYTATSRKTRILQAAPMTVQELFKRLEVSQTIPHTIAAYKALSKPRQDELKDIGAYIAGELRGGRRKAGDVLTRCAAVLDADGLGPGETETFIKRVAAAGLCCCVYSTAKHSPSAPRLRVVIPFSTDIPADMYPPVVRLLCRLIQPEMTWFDPSTHEAGRIMYWGTHCQDIDPVYFTQDGTGLLDVEAWLAQQLPSWRDVTTWPRFPREQAPARLTAKQEDPESKAGIVGAFCRCYNVPAAMEKFIPGVYEATNSDDRYTFAAGSTWGGAVLYEGGKFLYSNHATDPAGGKLVNAWDLVRLHLFVGLDDEAPEGARGNRLPSFKAMAELARSDNAVSDMLARESFTVATANFKGGLTDDEAALELGRREGDKLTAEIVKLALAAFGITARRNLITGKAEIKGMPPTYSAENAANSLPIWLMDKLRAVGIKAVTKTAIIDYLANILDENRYNPILDMFRETIWDGQHRFPELLRILGIPPESFHALLVRKWLIQCVALAHNTPGHVEAAEGVLTLQGPQGGGKTSTFRKLAVEDEWFAEGVTLDMRNRDDIIRAVSVWITELGEVESTLRREQSTLKAFVTQKVDRIRAPYERESADRPRRTSFGATVNLGRFLKDDTGDRRFWVVPVERADIDALQALKKEWVIQLWAEAYIWWQENPQGFRLSREERRHLNELNREYREQLPLEEEIRLAMNFDLPVEEWGKFSSTELGKELFTLAYQPGVASKIGRVLSKLAREDERITGTTSRGISYYRIPVRKTMVVR